MNYCIAAPSSKLCDFVKHYWTIENCLPYGQEHIQRIVPNGLPEIIFYLGDKPVSCDSTRPINENALIASQLKGFYDIKVTGSLSVFSVLFRPYGLSLFLGLPLNELYNQNVPLKFVVKNDVDELETKLPEAKSFHERIVVIENFFVRRLEKIKQNYNLDRIRECVKIINYTKGLVSIEYLASVVCLSRKQFERTFSVIDGTAPKQFLRTIRFQNAIHEKSVNKNLNLTSLTYMCGYYDQPHMANDFIKLSGMTPRQYSKDCDPYSDYFH